MSKPHAYDEIEKYKSYADTINQRVGSQFSTSYSDYDTVTVLLFYWQDSEAGFKREVEDLQDVFHNRFHFRTTIFAIPSGGPEVAVLQVLYNHIEFLKHGRNLVIVYYTGMAHRDRDTISGPIWIPTSWVHRADKNTPRVFPLSLLSSLDEALCDVLLIMDTSYLGLPLNSGVLTSRRKREFISASGVNGQALAAGPASFTYKLIRILKDAALSEGEGISVFQIYQKMITTPISSPATPIHGFLSVDSFSSIVLAPPHLKRRKSVGKQTHQERDVLISFTFATDAEETTSDILAWLQSDAPLGIKEMKAVTVDDWQKGPRLGIEFKLQVGDIPDQYVWANWLSTSAPPSIKDIVVDLGSSFDNNSTTILPDLQLQPFVDSLNISIESAKIFPTRNGRYEEVSVLLLLWEDEEPDLELRKDLVDLETIFKDEFTFSTEIWPIPSVDAQDILCQRILDLKTANNQSNKLVIVIYAGHGADTFYTTKESIWENRHGNTVNWSMLQPTLENAKCDALFILNCCYAFNAALSQPRAGSNVIMATSDRDQKSWALEWSYLRLLANKLQSFGDQPFTTEQLHNKMDSERQQGKLRGSPMRKLLNADEMHDIMIRKQPKRGVPSVGMEISKPRTSKDTMHKFYIEVTTNEPGKLSAQQWMHWFRAPGIPDYVQDLRFRTWVEVQEALDLERVKNAIK